MYIKENRINYTNYNSRTAVQIWLKIYVKVAKNPEMDIGYFSCRSNEK